MAITKRFASEEYVTESVTAVEERVTTLETETSELQEDVNDLKEDIENVGQPTGGITATAKTLLITVLRDCVTGSDQTANIDALEVALNASGGGNEEPDNPEVTLSSISASYTGGEVAVGTALTDLTGIIVLAKYSDGSSVAVTDYTLSGTIAEGENTITVSYGGMTTTFTVTGVAESGGEDIPEILYELVEPTTFDGTTSIDTGWNPFKEDQDFTIISKASLPNFADSYGAIDIGDRAIASAYQYLSGIYSLTIAVANTNMISVEGVKTDIYANINSVAITHAKGSSVCSVKILYKQTSDSEYSEKTGEFTYNVTTSFSDTMKIGYNGRQNKYLKGTIEKFEIYSRVLTDEEIEAYLA